MRIEVIGKHGFVAFSTKGCQDISFRKGRVSVISATARKLWFNIRNYLSRFFEMVEMGVSYNIPEGYLFLDQKRKLGLVKRIKKQIDKFDLTNEDLGHEIGQI